MPPASCPVRWRSCTRATLEMDGTASAINPATMASAMPISNNVIPRARTPLLASLRGGRRALAAVDGDVVASALRLVGAVGVHVVSVAGLKILVLVPPRVLAQLPDELGGQGGQRVRPVPRLDVVQVHALRDGLEIEPRGLDLRLLEVLEDVEPDRAGDEAQDHQDHHDLDQRHAAAAAESPLSLVLLLHGCPHFGTKLVSCMMGMRMEKTMNATPPPMTTIMIGSSRLVRAPTRTSSCPLFSPMAIMWCTSGGNCPLRLSGAAMLSPSRIASRASSITRASSELWTMFFTMSRAVSSGTPELSNVASVLAKRASASMRISSPKMGSVSCLASHHSRPFGVLSHRRTPQAASGSPTSSPYQ